MAGKTVLVVADRESDRLRLERTIADAGYEVRSIDAGMDPLKVAHTEQPALILLDLATDDMDGFKTCRELSLNPETRAIPVVLVSDPGHKVDSLWAEQQGADGLLARPCSPEEVLKEVRRLV